MMVKFCDQIYCRWYNKYYTMYCCKIGISDNIKKCVGRSYIHFEPRNVAKPNASSQLYEGWRDVRKELPPVEHEVYFVYDKEGSMGCAHYLGEGIFGGWPDVIAWMPLLSPPAFV